MAARELTIGSHRLAWGSRTYVMGIINVTPDSFSGDGLAAGADAGRAESSPEEWVARALEQGRRFVADGADILDVGGESTRPGAQAVSAEVELQRVEEVIRRLSAELDCLISIDTYKAEVAEAALTAGAHLVNDVWGLKADPRLAEVAARFHAPVILMHNRSSWAPPEIVERLGAGVIGAPYADLLADVRRELLESVALAHAAGIGDDRIILDPGIGFGKTVQQNLELVSKLDQIRRLGYPVLLGVSRKSFIGHTLNLPPDERLEGTSAATAIGIDRGADILRVHDVSAIVRVARLTDALVRTPFQ